MEALRQEVAGLIVFVIFSFPISGNAFIFGKSPEGD